MYETLKVSLKRSTENKIMLTIFIIATLSLGVFFTSKLWMYDDDPIQQTPLNQVIKSLDQTDVQLKKWEFNEEKNFMEVIIEKKHTGSDIIKPTFKYIGKEAEKNIELDTKVVFESDTMVVIELRNIPEKFKYITVAMDEYRDEETLQIEQKESGNVEVFSPKKPKRFVFVGDYREIDVNNKLATRDEKEYQKENLYVEIERINDEIKFIQDEKIPLKHRAVLELENDIKHFEEEMKFATEDEKQSLDRDIYMKKQAIKREFEEQEKLEEKINQLQKKINSLRKKIDFLDGKPVEIEEENEGDEQTAKGVEGEVEVDTVDKTDKTKDSKVN